MYLSEVQIRNFKNFNKARFKFKPGINTIIGENDSGKSNVLYAIRLLLDKRLNWLEREINEDWFSNSLDLWKGHTIIISLRFSEIGNSEEEAMLKYLTANNVGEGSLTWFCMPDDKTRKALREANDGHANVEEVIRGITVEDYSIYISFGAHVDFLDDKVYDSIVGNTDKKCFSYLEEFDESVLGSISGEKWNNGIDQVRKNLIDFTFINALRDAEYDLTQPYNPLMTILKRIEPMILESEKKDIKDLVNSINNKISSVEEIKKLSEEINSKMTDSVGNTYAPNILLRSCLSEDMKNLFGELDLIAHTGNETNINNMGLGSTNIIYISLKLLEYSYMQRVKNLQDKFFLLLFEEPEAHLHKHIQMSLFQKVGIDNNNPYAQIIMTTHSDHISAASKIGSMNIISKKNNMSLVMSPSQGLENKDTIRIERYLDAKRSTLLFAKNIILVEGDAEEILIPSMVKKVLGITLDEMGISLINIGSVGFKNIYKIFHNDRIQKKCAIITDMDEPIEVSDSKIAYERAKTRRYEIEEESTSNKWVHGFYAKNTFEVEIVKNNEKFVHKLIDEFYVNDTTRINKKKDINSSSPVQYGKQILKIANDKGKGWMALALSEIIDYSFSIPQYIVDALIFSGKDELKRKNLALILKHFYKCIGEISISENINDDKTQLIDLINNTIIKYPNYTISRVLQSLKRQG